MTPSAKLTPLAKPMPLVSVIVPVRNGVKFLADAIETIRSQAYKPLEIIVIDDGSTDGSAALAQSLGTDIRIFEQRQRGPAAARNTGIRAANGEILAFLDADDLWTPDKLRMQVGYLVENDLDIVTGYVQMLSLLGADASPSHAPGKTRNTPYLDVNLGAMICRKSVMERVGLFDETLSFAEDVDWYLRVQENNIRIGSMPIISLYYRRHPANVTVSGDGVRAVYNYYWQVVRRAEKRRGSSFGQTPDVIRLHQYLPAPSTDPMLSVSLVLPVIASTMQHAESWMTALHSLDGQWSHVQEVIVVTAEPLTLPELGIPARVVHVESVNMPTLLNAGIAEAAGEAIAFITPDDLRLPDSIEKQLQVLREQPFLDYITGFRHIDLAAGVARPTSLNEDSMRNNALQLSLGTLIARRRLFEREGGFDPAHPHAYESAWFSIMMDRAVPFHILLEDVTRHLVHANHVLVKAHDDYLAEIPRIRFESIRRRRHEMKYRA